MPCYQNKDEERTQKVDLLNTNQVSRNKTYVDCKSYCKRSLVFLSSFCSLDQHFGNLKQIYKCGVYTEFE